VVYQGIPASNEFIITSSWSYHGSPLPYVQFDPSRIDYSTLAVAQLPGYAAALENKDRVRAAEIPVEKINGPILMITGKDDQMWPSTALSDIAMERLKRNSFPHAYDHVCYEKAGHDIGPPYQPSLVRIRHTVVPFIAIGGTQKANAQASEDSWRRVLSLLSSTMKGSSKGE
jgi:dienelactone hydrolase